MCRPGLNRLWILTALLPIVLLRVNPATAQTFSSGSTGADGVFSPTTNQTLQLPPSGVFNFTTINIPSNVSVTFLRNAKNTPVTMLATGNVTILGSININGQDGGLGGPGGFSGGPGGRVNSGALFGVQGFSGEGPGNGLGATNGGGGGAGYSEDGQAGGGDNNGGGPAGTRYGTNNLLPLIGGSGGGGGSGNLNGTGFGGGGGGAILIASSGTLSFGNLNTPSATISAIGGDGIASCGVNSGGAGSGGGIRIVANTIVGSPNLLVGGGSGHTACAFRGNGGDGSPGYVRVEAFNLSGFRLQTPVAHLVLSQPNPVVTNAQLTITSVGGINAPTAPLASFLTPPDIVVPATVANPVTVAIAASNIPTGTVIQVTLTPIIGTRTTVSSTPLSGTLASSTATASVNLPGVTSVITASATINLTSAQAGPPIFVNGERVARMEVTSSFGGRTETVYVTHSGRRMASRDLQK